MKTSQVVLFIDIFILMNNGYLLLFIPLPKANPGNQAHCLFILWWCLAARQNDWHEIFQGVVANACSVEATTRSRSPHHVQAALLGPTLLICPRYMCHFLTNELSSSWITALKLSWCRMSWNVWQLVVEATSVSEMEDWPIEFSC